MIISVVDRVENIVGKGENAGYQHFLLFLQCFEKAPFPDMSKGIIVWEWVKKNTQAFLQQCFCFHAAENTIHFFSLKCLFFVFI